MPMLPWSALNKDEREWVMERAGIREFDGGQSRREAYEGAMGDLYRYRRERKKAREAAAAEDAMDVPENDVGVEAWA